MSSSSKKQLRKEQKNAAMTERQRAQQQEAKKLKRMTTLFVVVLAVVLCSAVLVLSLRAYNNSGVRERNTVALTVNDHELNNVEFGYFYYDAINSFYTSLVNNYGSNAAAYAQVLYNIDFTQPLDGQYQDEENQVTWADYFVDQALTSAKNIYSLYDDAMANNYTLSEEDQASLDAAIEELPSIAKAYNYSTFKGYLRGMYGNGATKDSYLEYYKTSTIATLYYNAHGESLVYSDEELRAYEGDKSAEYNAYSYHTYYVSRANYLTGGTEDEDGKVTYTDAEQEAAAKAAEVDAKQLVNSADSLKNLQTAILKLKVNAENEDATTSAYIDQSYSSVNSFIRDWVTDSSRKEGDVTYIANTTEVENEDGTTATQINGYYVVYFEEINDNNFPLANVRHILVGFEGGSTDDSGNTTYSDEEKAAALEKANALLNQWKNGEATEDSFAALVHDNTADDGSKETGGLYEEIYPGEMVENFDAWCFEDGRKAGDTGVVESPHGYHVMYYVGDDELSYRDYMVSNVKRNEDMTAWSNGLLEAATVTEGDWSYLNTTITFSA